MMTCPPKNWFSYYVRTGIEKRVIEMARRSYRPKRIISKLREVEALLGQSSTIDEAARKTRVTEQTYCRWRRQYGGIRIGEVARSKEPRLANSFLSRIQENITRPKMWRCSNEPDYRHWLPAQDDVRTFFQNTKDEIQIPAYAHPRWVQCVRDTVLWPPWEIPLVSQRLQVAWRKWELGQAFLFYWTRWWLREGIPSATAAQWPS